MDPEIFNQLGHIGLALCVAMGFSYLIILPNLDYDPPKWLKTPAIIIFIIALTIALAAEARSGKENGDKHPVERADR
jgi:hypothetical protein